MQLTSGVEDWKHMEAQGGHFKQLIWCCLLAG